MHPKDADGIVNSVDTDQTAPLLIWVCTVGPDLSVRRHRNITVRFKLLWMFIAPWKHPRSIDLYGNFIYTVFHIYFLLRFL